jgi:hypothetical protein
MPQISVTSNSFSTQIGANELNTSQTLRFSVCSIKFPVGYIPSSGINFLDESISPGNTNLGTIEVKKKEEIQQYEILTANAEQGVEILNIQNKLRVDVEIAGADSTFEPCNLDFNHDGVVSAKDINKLYQGIPFYNTNLDINNDGIVDQADYVLAQEYIGYSCEEPTSVGCALDFDGDGVVTVNDIKAIYENDKLPYNPIYDLNNDGVLDQQDYQLALEYVGYLCDESSNPPDSGVQQPVLNLDCLTFVAGSSQWLDSSGNDYHFNASDFGYPNNNYAPPVKNTDGSIAVGHDKVFFGGSETAQPAFAGFNRPAIRYLSPPNTNDIPYEIDFREKYIPDIDQSFSIEYVIKFHDGINQGNDTGGITSDNDNQGVSNPNIQGLGGYANYGIGGFNFSIGAGSNTNYAIDPSVFIPVRGVTFRVSGGYPGYNSSSEMGYSQYGNISVDYDFGLDPFLGIPSGQKFVVQLTQFSHPTDGFTRMYINGVLVQEFTGKRGIGLPFISNDATMQFRIGVNVQGGIQPPDVIDIYAFKVYDNFLSYAEILNNYQNYVEKYQV